MSCSRTCGRLLNEKGVSVVITAIVWTARPYVAHCVEMIMKCLNELCINLSPLMLLRCIMRVKVLF